jgi:hypothetical protein
MEFQAFEPGIEVNGQTVWAIVDGFIFSKQTPSRILVAEGIGTMGKDSVVKIDPNAWYSQEAWLRAFKQISSSLGPQVLMNIGKRIPENAIFPPWVVDIDTAIQSIDVAYHLNHRKQGKVMFDLGTKEMLEGIGHYGYERPNPHKALIVSECANPYPCDFDRGILSTMARRFEPTATVAHVNEQRCRKTGADSCVYHVKW